MKVTGQVYSVNNDPKVGLFVAKDESGWLHIMKLPNDQNNVWPSKEWIEMHLQVTLTLLKEFDEIINWGEFCN